MDDTQFCDEQEHKHYDEMKEKGNKLENRKLMKTVKKKCSY